MSAEERAAVVQEAHSWLNTPYHPHGRVKGAGVDCAMLPAEVYKACNLIPHVDPEFYPPDWHLHRDEERYLAVVLSQGAKPTDVPLPGDLVLYKWGRAFAHGAIVIEWPMVIHAFIDVGVVMANGLAGRLADREHRFYTLWSD